MNKTATILRSTLAALLIGALSVPGLALADKHGKGHHGGHRGGHHGHWRHHDEVVVVREPVYLAPRAVYRAPRPVYVAPAPVWAPVGNSLTLVLGTRW